MTTARDRLAGLVRNVHSYVESVPDEDASPEDKLDAAGVVVWDAVTRHLSLPALPLHATSIVAWRQPLGGTAEPCGMSETESVNAAETSPFVPGATYDLWVTGRNSVGDGVASSKIQWTAPV